MMSIIGGLIAAALCVFGLCFTWFGQKGYIYFLKGLAASLPALLIVGGVIAVIAGIGSLKDRAATAREEAESAAKPAGKPEDKK